MINNLTDEQRAKFPEYVERWTKIGLCTDPSNREEADKCLHRAYKAAGMDNLRKIVWSDSPYASLILIAIIQNKKVSAYFRETF